MAHTLGEQILNHGDAEETEKRGDREAVNSSGSLILPAFLRSLRVSVVQNLHSFSTKMKRKCHWVCVGEVKHGIRRFGAQSHASPMARTLGEKILNHGDTEETEKRGDREAVNSSGSLFLPVFLRSLRVSVVQNLHSFSTKMKRKCHWAQSPQRKAKDPISAISAPLREP